MSESSTNTNLKNAIFTRYIVALSNWPAPATGKADLIAVGSHHGPSRNTGPLIIGPQTGSYYPVSAWYWDLRPSPEGPLLPRSGASGHHVYLPYQRLTLTACAVLYYSSNSTRRAIISEGVCVCVSVCVLPIIDEASLPLYLALLIFIVKQ